jgi:hypothetical protein
MSSFSIALTAMVFSCSVPALRSRILKVSAGSPSLFFAKAPDSAMRMFSFFAESILKKSGKESGHGLMERPVISSCPSFPQDTGGTR